MPDNQDRFREVGPSCDWLGLVWMNKGSDLNVPARVSSGGPGRPAADPVSTDPASLQPISYCLTGGPILSFHRLQPQELVEGLERWENEAQLFYLIRRVREEGASWFPSQVLLKNRCCSSLLCWSASHLFLVSFIWSKSHTIFWMFLAFDNLISKIWFVLFKKQGIYSSEIRQIVWRIEVEDIL